MENPSIWSGIDIADELIRNSIQQLHLLGTGL